MEAFSTLAIDAFLKLLVPLSVAAVLAFFWWRAGTTHSIMERLWRIVAGNSPISNQRLATFMEETRELERFRFVYGVSIESSAELNKFLAWRERHRIPIRKIQLIRSWFDAKAEDFIVQPTLSAIVLRFIICFSFVVATFISLFIAVSDKALLKTNTSKIWFMTDGSIVGRPLLGKPVALTQCSSLNSAPLVSLGFTKNEERIICEAAMEGSLKGEIEKTIKDQRQLGFALEMIFIFLFFCSGYHFGASVLAHRLYRHVSHLDKG